MPENDVQYVYKILGKRVHHNTISKNLLYTAIHFYILYITQKLITCMHLHDIYIYIHTHTPSYRQQKLGKTKITTHFSQRMKCSWSMLKCIFNFYLNLDKKSNSAMNPVCLINCQASRYCC